jgi:hypothetical protein
MSIFDDSVTLVAGDDSVQVSAYGAHVLSWKVDKTERLWLSSLSATDMSAPVRATICPSSVFPIFNQMCRHLLPAGAWRHTHRVPPVRASGSPAAPRLCKGEEMACRQSVQCFEMGTASIGHSHPGKRQQHPRFVGSRVQAGAHGSFDCVVNCVLFRLKQVEGSASRLTF